MKLQEKIILLLLTFLFIAGCGGIQTKSTLEKNLSSWVGHSSSELIESWGIPYRVFSLGNGSKFIEYAYSNTIKGGGTPYTKRVQTDHTGTLTNNRNLNRIDYSGTSTTNVERRTQEWEQENFCKVVFTADQRDIIKSWQWEGNNCTTFGGAFWGHLLQGLGDAMQTQ